MKENYILLQILFLASNPILVIGGEIKLKECPPDRRPKNESNFILETLQIEDCDGQPCTVLKGRTYSIDGTSWFNYSTKKLRLKVFVIISPLSPVFLFRINVCHFIKRDACRNITAGSRVQGKTDWYINEIFPTGQGSLMFILLNDFRVPVWCGKLDVILKNKERGNTLLHVLEGVRPTKILQVIHGVTTQIPPQLKTSTDVNYGDTSDIILTEDVSER